jgi:hypothetical protein
VIANAIAGGAGEAPSAARDGAVEEGRGLDELVDEPAREAVLRAEDSGSRARSRGARQPACRGARASSAGTAGKGTPTLSSGAPYVAFPRARMRRVGRAGHHVAAPRSRGRFTAGDERFLEGQEAVVGTAASSAGRKLRQVRARALRRAGRGSTPPPRRSSPCRVRTTARSGARSSRANAAVEGAAGSSRSERARLAVSQAQHGGRGPAPPARSCGGA